VTFEIVNPRSLGEPKGWSNGLLAPAGGRLLFVAGQAGWEEEAAGEPLDFAAQFVRALDKVLAVIAEAGGRPQDLARLTIYVTDLAAYRAARRAVGEAWRARLGRFYPAVALVEVKGLMDRGAMVEMEATAVIAGPSGGGA
jgi:enamine deaminase RidA (YjgF/YER057c/UK114 family)